jgi:hypothetical protein
MPLICIYYENNPIKMQKELIVMDSVWRQLNKFGMTMKRQRMETYYADSFYVHNIVINAKYNRIMLNNNDIKEMIINLDKYLINDITDIVCSYVYHTNNINFKSGTLSQKISTFIDYSLLEANFTIVARKEDRKVYVNAIDDNYVCIIEKTHDHIILKNVHRGDELSAIVKHYTDEKYTQTSSGIFKALCL